MLYFSQKLWPDTGGTEGNFKDCILQPDLLAVRSDDLHGSFSLANLWHSKIRRGFLTQPCPHVCLHCNTFKISCCSISTYLFYSTEGTKSSQRQIFRCCMWLTYYKIIEIYWTPSPAPTFLWPFFPRSCLRFPQWSSQSWCLYHLKEPQLNRKMSLPTPYTINSLLQISRFLPYRGSSATDCGLFGD